MNPTERPAAGVFCDTITVPESVIDQNGHVSNVAYVQWMQDVAVRHFAAVHGVEPMRRAGGSWVVRSHRVEYRRPAFAGERLEIATWIVDFQRVRSRRRYQFVRVADGCLLAHGETDWVFVNAASGRPCSIPAAIRQAFAPVAPEPKP